MYRRIVQHMRQGNFSSPSCLKNQISLPFCHPKEPFIIFPSTFKRRVSIRLLGRCKNLTRIFPRDLGGSPPSARPQAHEAGRRRVPPLTMEKVRCNRDLPLMYHSCTSQITKVERKHTIFTRFLLFTLDMSWYISQLKIMSVKRCVCVCVKYTHI